jgi:hypothetical protein
MQIELEFQLDEPVNIASVDPFRCLAADSRCKKWSESGKWFGQKFPEKVEFWRLTGSSAGLFYWSRWKRDSSNQGVRSAYIWDCKLDSILSRHDFLTENYRRHEIEFFVA